MCHTFYSFFLKIYFCVSFCTVSSTVSSSLLIFSSVMSNLLLIPSSVFFTLNVVAFVFRNLIWIFYICICLYHIYSFFYLLEYKNIVVTIILMSLSTKSVLFVISGSVSMDWFLSLFSVIFSRLCAHPIIFYWMSDIMFFPWDIFVLLLACLSLFWKAIKWLGNNSFLSRLAFNF